MDASVGAAGRRWSRGACAVVALGVALAAGFTANLAVEIDAVAVAWPPVAAWLLGTALSGGLGLVGWWLAGEAFERRETRRIAAWTYLGALAFALTVLVTIAARFAEGRTPVEPQFDVLVAAAGGGLAGAAAGHRAVLAHREAAAAERARDTMAFLNRTLRHEVLNGVHLVGGHAATLRNHVDDGDAPASLSTIEETTVELTELIEDVRQVADVHAGTVDLYPVDVAGLLAEEAAWLRGTHPAAAVETDLPRSATARATGALQYAFRNLLAGAAGDGSARSWQAWDARRSTNGGSRDDDAPAVEVTLDVAPDRLVARIRGGPGPVPEPGTDEARAFGLHLARTIVEGYDGRLRVETDPGGTIFVVELPRPWSGADDAGCLRE